MLWYPYGEKGIQSFFENNPNSARDRVWICATVSSRIHEVVLCGSIRSWMKFFPRGHISLHYESSWTLRARFPAEKLHGFLIWITDRVWKRSHGLSTSVSWIATEEGATTFSQLIATTAYGMKEFFPCSRSSGGILTSCKTPEERIINLRRECDSLWQQYYETRRARYHRWFVLYYQ